MDGCIDVNTTGSMITVGIARPVKRNALNEYMFAQLATIFRQARLRPDVSVVLIHGDDTCFSAGHDLDDFRKMWPQQSDGVVIECIDALLSIGKPIVAAVNGPAVGFGATMLLSADYVVAGKNSSYRFPFSELGIVPEAGSSALLARRVGDLCARDWLLSSRRVGAKEALEKGLVSVVVEDSNVIQTAIQYAEMLSSKSAEVLQLIRRLIDDGVHRSARQAAHAEFALLNILVQKLSQTYRSH